MGPDAHGRAGVAAALALQGYVAEERVAALQMGIHFHGGDHGTEMPGSKLGDVVGSTRHG